MVTGPEHSESRDHQLARRPVGARVEGGCHCDQIMRVRGLGGTHSSGRHSSFIFPPFHLRWRGAAARRGRFMPAARFCDPRAAFRFWIRSSVRPSARSGGSLGFRPGRLLRRAGVGRVPSLLLTPCWTGRQRRSDVRPEGPQSHVLHHNNTDRTCRGGWTVSVVREWRVRVWENRPCRIIGLLILKHTCEDPPNI